MFGNKKNILPPRPKPPEADEILEDLKNSANKDDVAFKLLARGTNADQYFIKTINEYNSCRPILQLNSRGK